MRNSSKTNNFSDNSKRADRLSRLTTINLVALLVLCLLETFVAERNWLTIGLLYLPQHWIGVPGAVLVLWSLARKQGKLLLWNMLGSAFFVLYFLGFNVPLQAGSTLTGTRLRVMTYNINYGSRGAANIMKVVHAVQPDVLCLQETRANWPDPDPVPTIQRMLPGWHVERGSEVTTLSRYPIILRRTHDMPIKTGRVILETQIAVKGRLLSVFNVHMSTAAVATHHPDSRWHRLVGLPIYTGATADLRRRQTRVLLDVTSRVAPPYVVAGDFNNPPRGLIYRALTARFQDAFHAAGWGWGYTFRSDLPVLRIDYIFLGPGVRTSHSFVPQVSTSDHRPLVADIILF
jgi:endonuclease/exonuclease/phosphatase family metal-dependent hydrolase